MAAYNGSRRGRRASAGSDLESPPVMSMRLVIIAIALRKSIECDLNNAESEL